MNAPLQNETQAVAETTTAPAATLKTRRKALLIALGLATVVAAAGYGAYYVSVAQYHEDTDDAYVNGNLVQLTPQVSGTVVAVKAGEPIVSLDPADAEVALDNARAQLAQTVRQVSALYVNNNVYAATIAQREADLSRARDDLRRRTTVAEAGAVSAEDIGHARDTVRAAEAALETVRQQLASNRTLTAQTTVAAHPSVQAAAAKLRDAYLANARNTLPAPVTGYVARRSVQVGQRVAPGTPMMAIVPLDGVWIDANFKEMQMKHIRIGQPVELRADMYGNAVTYHGKVAGFSAGTGSAFATLPAQNATGNWIKVVQRLPVRIQLDPAELREHPLQIGLSMQVEINTRGAASIPRTQPAVPLNTATRTDVFRRYGEDANAEITRIIAQNSTGEAGAQTQLAHAGTPRNTAPQM